MDSFFIYLIFINILSFILMGWDKYCAIKNKWRIPEKTLIGLSIIGGGIGIYLGMKTFRHKTQKPIFQILVPITVIIIIYLLLK